jgi:putative hemolysin
MIQSSKASVLPIWFEGQNGPLFHLASRFSLTLRLSLLVSEFRRFTSTTLHVNIGQVIPFADLKFGSDRKLLTEELHGIVHALAEPRALAAPGRMRKVRGVGRLARQKARKVGKLARSKARGVTRLARRKLRLRRGRTRGLP